MSHLASVPSKKSWIALAALLFATSSCLPHGPDSRDAAAPNERSTAAPPRLLEGLGEHHHPISTPSALAQRYFDQALVLVFGFNHEAAIASFEHALQLDPDCGMCAWGIALALGPNINRPMGPEAAARAHRETQRARRLLARRGTAREKAYAAALALRYSEPPADASARSEPTDRAALDLAYANAMRDLSRADPSDLDAATLFAESLMDLYPWAYWTEDGEPREFTREIVATLEAVLERDPQHTGANHYYIHAVEEFYPERGEAAADRLGALAPDAGHLVHMPSHIYWRVGRYEEASDINQRAAEADERFSAWCRAGAFYQATYYPHNVHFLWAAAIAEGRRELAISTARKLEAVTRPGLDEIPVLQEFVATPILTLARFGLWDPILAEPKPDEEHVYLTGIWHYARALAQLRTGSPERARASRRALEQALDDERAAQLVLAGGTSSARALLEIGRAHLDAELAWASGERDAAITQLERASRLHDALPYMEPPPWYAPPRQTLGAMLLELGRPEAAEAVYLKDLEQYPKNGWSLFGLAQSLRARGDRARASWAEQGFAQAWRRADVELTRSRF